MSDYRDELAAAHSRIAELEDKIKSLEEAARPTSPRFSGQTNEALRALDAEVARLRDVADPTKSGKKRAIISWIGVVFPLLGMTFTFLKLPLVATAMSAIFISLIVYNFSLARKLTRDTAHLREAEAKLRDAQRIAELETELGDVKQKTRVALDAPAANADVAEEQMTTVHAAAVRRA